MSLVIANAGRAAIVALACFTALTLRREERGRERSAALVLEAADVHELCRRSGCREGVFYERARALGMSGLTLRPEPLARFLESKEALRFSAEEVAKLRATGVAAAEAPLKPGSVWVKDERLVGRLEAAARAGGVSLKSARFGRMRVVEVPDGARAEDVSAGFDPEAAAAAAVAGLMPVYRAATTADLRLAVAAPAPSAVLLDASPDAYDPAARAGLEAALAARRSWSVAPAAASAALPGAERLLSFVELPASTPPAELLRLAEGQGTSLLILRLDPGAGPEAAVASLRAAARSLRGHGTAPAWPSGLAEFRRPGKTERAARAAAALLVAVLGPLWALRSALAAARRASRSGMLPESAPVREAAAGLAAAAAAAVLAGCAARALLADGSGAAGPVLSTARAAAVLVAAAGFAGLYLAEPKADLRRRRTLINALTAAAGVWLLVAPPAAVARWAFGLGALAAWKAGWWWAPARWPEIVVGVPALIVGLCLYAEGLGSRDGGGSDPRPWLLAGLAAPAWTVAAFCRTRAPLAGVFLQTTQCLALGLCLGAAAWAARAWRSNRAESELKTPEA